MDPIRPNELRPPGEREAIARVEAVYAAVDDMNPMDLEPALIPALDPGERDERLEALEMLADGLGRGELLDSARDELREALVGRLSVRPHYVFGLRPSGLGRAEDLAAVVAALEDLVAVAVVEDRLDLDDAGVLAAPGRAILGLGRADDAGAADRDATDNLLPPPGAAELYATGAPSDADWAEAEDGSTAIDLEDRDRDLPRW